MKKDNYIISFIGRSTIGKSRIISACIESKKIGESMHKNNNKGKTKSNTIYKINYNKGNNFELINKFNEIADEYLVKIKDSEDKYKFEVEKFKEKFKEISKEFAGIEKFKDTVEDKKELIDWINDYLEIVKVKISERIEIKKNENIEDDIISYFELFEEVLAYNDLFDIEVELKASKEFERILIQNRLKQIVLIDTRGVFDSTGEVQRSFSNQIPDINIFLFDEKGITEYQFNEIYKELKPIFGKAFETCIRTPTPITAPILTIDSCINPRQSKILAKKFELLNGFLQDKNVLEGDTIFDKMLRDNLGTILPQIPNQEDHCYSDEKMMELNNKYDEIIFKLFKKVLKLKNDEETTIRDISEKCKNPEYKENLINSTIYGNDFCLFNKYAKRCSMAVDGLGNHLNPKPQTDKIKEHIDNIFFKDLNNSWAKDEYLRNIVTFEGANYINDSIEMIRTNKSELNVEQISEYLFVLKNSLASCQESLSDRKAYIFFTDSGYEKLRISDEYYYKSINDTIKFSNAGKTYYKIYEELSDNKESYAFYSALLDIITNSTIMLVKEKFKIEDLDVIRDGVESL